MLIFNLHCQLVLCISGNILHKRKTSQCKIRIVPEEGWFGQPKYSTPPVKINVRCVGFCLYILLILILKVGNISATFDERFLCCSDKR